MGRPRLALLGLESTVGEFWWFSLRLGFSLQRMGVALWRVGFFLLRLGISIRGMGFSFWIQ